MTTTLTPPSSSHGDDASWGYTADQSQVCYRIGSQTRDTAADIQPQNPGHGRIGTAHSDHATKNPSASHNGNSAATSYQTDVHMATRRMHSADNLSAARWDKSADNGVLSPPFESGEDRAGPAADWPMQSTQRTSVDSKRAAPQVMTVPTKDDSKWIHRDKLAKIESQELQAAGIYIPRSRAPSKQRRERSVRRGTESSDQGQNRSRKNSATAEQRALETAGPAWDLRTPEEIAEEEANAYFASNGLTGGSRIPVAKTSPAPIPLDYLERNTTLARKLPDSPEDGAILYTKTRSRSASAGIRDADANGALPPGKRSVTDISPKKGTPTNRKTSGPAKTPPNTRPKTRSGSNSGSGTRPSTRSGEISGSKAPEGDPPWMVNNYKPDPRLPPDQQLLPTVARRLQQEKWEKEGKFGDVYDRDFKPLNDNVFLRPPEAEKSPTEEETQQTDQWPLKPLESKSPVLRQGSYSTMPKITDKSPSSPLSPRPPTISRLSNHQQDPQETQNPEAVQEETQNPENKRGGCGCCVVM